MSTSYYRLNPPITHLRLEDKGGHDRISIWVNHGLAGSLIVSKRETRGIVQMFTCYESDDKCPLRSHWAGTERGAVITVNDATISDEAVVISEYGELLTVAEVKRRDGAKRSDGMPTELFGYEKPAAREPVACCDCRADSTASTRGGRNKAERGSRRRRDKGGDSIALAGTVNHICVKSSLVV